MRREWIEINFSIFETKYIIVNVFLENFRDDVETKPHSGTLFPLVTYVVGLVECLVRIRNLDNQTIGIRLDKLESLDSL